MIMIKQFLYHVDAPVHIPTLPPCCITLFLQSVDGFSEVLQRPSPPTFTRVCGFEQHISTQDVRVRIGRPRNVTSSF